VRILGLTLASLDLAAQSAFCGERLGSPVHKAAGGACEVPLRASAIRFEQASPGVDPRYHFAINVPRGSIAEAAAWIEDRHELLAFHGEPDEEEGATGRAFRAWRVSILFSRRRRKPAPRSPCASPRTGDLTSTDGAGCGVRSLPGKHTPHGCPPPIHTGNASAPSLGIGSQPGAPILAYPLIGLAKLSASCREADRS
jgi:hypothetical protein